MLKLTKHVYISTLTSLQDPDMLKIDVSPGDYKFTSFSSGYVFAKEADFEKLKLIKIFNTRCGDKGLCGTYHGGPEFTDPTQLKLFKTWLCKRFDFNQSYDGKYSESLIYDSYESLIYDYDSDESQSDVDDLEEVVTDSEKVDHDSKKVKPNPEESGSHSEKDNLGKHKTATKLKRKEIYFNQYLDAYDSDGNSIYSDQYENSFEERWRKTIRNPSTVRAINEFHNLPYMFYLNKQIKHYDLLTLEETDPVESVYLWKVKEKDEHIGYVVEKDLEVMYGDIAGLGIFERALAFGNFCPQGGTEDVESIKYPCSFEKCECDTTYKKY